MLTGLRGRTYVLDSEWAASSSPMGCEVREDIGGEVCAFSEMVDHVSPLREFYEPLVDLSLGAAKASSPT